MAVDLFKKIHVPGWMWIAVTTVAGFATVAWANLEKTAIVSQIIESKESIKAGESRMKAQEDFTNYQERRLIILETKQEFIVDGVKSVLDSQKEINKKLDRMSRNRIYQEPKGAIHEIAD